MSFDEDFLIGGLSLSFAWAEAPARPKIQLVIRTEMMMFFNAGAYGSNVIPTRSVPA
jgi:hypothetical protein